jgi:4-nitrophenyl phosphatase
LATGGIIIARPAAHKQESAGGFRGREMTMAIEGIILDLDGTLYRGTEQVPGAAHFVADMTARAIRCLFVTNRANRLAPEICAQLRTYGIACRDEDVLTGAQAAAGVLRQGSAYVVGEKALAEELARHGIRITDEAPDFVVVGLDRQFTYEKMDRANRFIRAGARFIATNADKSMNVEGGHIAPGAGAIVAAIAAASGRAPEIIGKPERWIVDASLERLALRPEQAIMVGDNLETDIPAGHKTCVRTALILTGISRREDLAGAAFQPTWIVEDFKELTAVIDRERERGR